MIEWLLDLDRKALLFINGQHNTFLDAVLYAVSDKWIWIPFYVFLAVVLYRHYRPFFFKILVAVAVMITLSDQLASGVIKNQVMRLRPCHDPELSPLIHLVNGYCGGMYGFVSSHASNTFALAVFLFFVFKRRYPQASSMLFVWAALVSFSRVYLGVHYPLDVIGGAICGTAVAGVVHIIFQRIFPQPE